MQSPQIMLVDDTLADLQLIQMIIGMVDPKLTVTTAGSGDEAIQQLRARNAVFPKVILMDLRMFGKTGLETLAELKADPVLKKIPVCIFSNGDFELDVRRAYELGASFYFRKPDGIDELKDFFRCFKTIWFDYACLPT